MVVAPETESIYTKILGAVLLIMIVATIGLYFAGMTIWMDRLSAFFPIVFIFFILSIIINMLGCCAGGSSND